MAKKYPEFNSEFQAAIAVSDDPSANELEELISQLQDNPSTMPSRDGLWPVHTFLRAALANEGIKNEWMKRSINEIARTRENLNSIEIDEALTILQGSGQTKYECFLPEFPFDPDVILKLALRKASKKLKEKYPQQVILPSDIEHFTVRITGYAAVSGNLQGIEDMICIGSTIKVKGNNHRISLTLGANKVLRAR